MDPSKPNDPSVDQSQPIPRSRPGNDEVLEGEIIDRGVPIGRQRTTPPPSAPPTPPRTRPSTRRTVLLVLAAVAALVCLGGSLTAYVLYDKATTPDRSTPEGVIEQYVDVKFNVRDDHRARLFECPSADITAVSSTLNEVKALEARYSTSATVRPGSFAVSVNGDEADVDGTLNIVVTESSGGQSITEQRWRFHLSKNRTWLLCKATKLS
ncbi:hypothetical protein [Dactylosporangium sp. NPDC048998]|uniref:hypothetical protein n=1 Tax=Dactylosporangium sp. NPDC048998 TaxID=3363976 RepID=UPI003717FE97